MRVGLFKPIQTDTYHLFHSDTIATCTKIFKVACITESRMSHRFYDAELRLQSVILIETWLPRRNCLGKRSIEDVNRALDLLIVWRDGIELISRQTWSDDDISVIRRYPQRRISIDFDEYVHWILIILFQETGDFALSLLIAVRFERDDRSVQTNGSKEELSYIILQNRTNKHTFLDFSFYVIYR